MKKAVFIGFEIFFVIFTIIIVCFAGYIIYSLTVNAIPLTLSTINDQNLTIKVFNEQGLELKEYNNYNSETIDLNLLPNYTTKAFISIEDKNFYKHRGINIKRILKASVTNLKSLSFKEGASTITQQLIKNTYLTNKKTFSRKINEIKLALDLEKKLTKDEILNNYLNIIYFGNNCYGIESASKYYYSKPAQDLTLSESATLAGLIKSPNYYSLINHPDRALNRRNLVLDNMLQDGHISQIDCIAAKNSGLNLNITTKRKNKLNSYSQSAIDEACKILRMPEKQIAIGGYKIHTYQNKNMQNAIQNILQNTEIDNDYAFINIDSKTGGIKAFLGSSDYKILDHTRQIGSIAKPLFVYAPAFNEDILTPASLILDEPLNINGYTPQNVTGNYLGYINARDALSKSLNIPAVKVASYVGLNKINSYANKLHLPLSDKDMSYSVALGGLTYGYNLKDLAGAYSVFVNNGNYIAPKFVHYITDKNNKIIYKNNITPENVFRSDASYLTTDILKTCAKSGTAKKLASLDFDIASKTGTVGSKRGNLDAYNISYTTEDIMAVWFGNLTNQYINTTGGNKPTQIIKNYCEEIYNNHKPEDFAKPSSVESYEIDLTELEQNHLIAKASNFTPEKNKKTELFSKFNPPKTMPTPTAIQHLQLSGNVQDGKAILSFNAADYIHYEIYRKTKNNEKLIGEIFDKNGKIEFFDEMIENQKNEYYVIAKINNDFSVTSNKITLINTGVSIKPKWYI